jgi:hypothetical protein
VTATVPGGLLPPLPGLPTNAKIASAGTAQMNELKDYLVRKQRGKPGVDPLSTTHSNYVVQMRKIGLGVTKQGKVIALPGGASK